MCIKKHNLFIFLIGIMFVSELTAEDLELNVVGVGDSKASAIIDAQRNALRTSYGEFVSTNLTVLNNELTKNETVNLVSGTIKDFEVLSESINDFAVPPIVEVLLRVTVSKGKLITFAKAIGDTVQVQGSLFGAEIRQQEINKKNELVALEHLEKKAKQMSAFFDFETKVGTPQQSTLSDNDFVISVVVQLTPNKNFTNLMSALSTTLKQISMSKTERGKYNELNVPIYKLGLMSVLNPECYRMKGGYSRDNPFDSKNFIEGELTKIITNVTYTLEDRKKTWPIDIVETEKSSFGRGYYNHKCKFGDLKNLYFRSPKAAQVLLAINDHVHQSAFNYELSRQTSAEKKLLLPYGPTTHLNWEQGYSYGIFGHERARSAYANLVIRHMPKDDKARVQSCPPKNNALDYGYDICMGDNDWSSYVLDVSHKFWGTKYQGGIRHVRPASAFRSKRTFHAWMPNWEQAPLTLSRTQCRGSVNRRQKGSNSTADGASTYGDRPSCHFYSTTELIYAPNLESRYLHNKEPEDLGYLLVRQKKDIFAELYFEDVVSKDMLSRITAYAVDADNQTKYQGLYD